MNFELSDEQKDIQKAAREFAHGEFDPDLALELDEGAKFPESLWKKAAQLGFIGMHYPEELGGQGLASSKIFWSSKLFAGWTPASGAL